MSDSQTNITSTIIELAVDNLTNLIAAEISPTVKQIKKKQFIFQNIHSYFFIVSIYNFSPNFS